MKKEKGVTLISLIIYVILMTFVIAGVSLITASFYTNINEFDEESETAVSFAKFNMYFLTDIKRNDVDVVEYGSNYIVLSYVIDETTINNGGVTVQTGETKTVEYSVQDDILYRDKVKICEDVEDISIQVTDNDTVITITMIIDGTERSTTYSVETFGTETDNSGTIIID